MRDPSVVVHGGLSDPVDGAPLMNGPVFAAPFRLRGDPQDQAFTYARHGNPTWTAYETALEQLEGGPCLSFASGMAAVAAVLCATLRPGDAVLLPGDGYYTSRQLGLEYLAGMGVEVRTGPSGVAPSAADLSGCRLVLVESPSNPGLEVSDLERWVAVAHACGALVAVDNTTVTALGQKPLNLGADYSLASDTKALAGHSDLLLGHVAARTQALLVPIRAWRDQVGAIAGPMEVWLAHRSLATLDVRLERQCRTALRAAEMLLDHPAVSSCRYPGLPSDPAHAVARRQMRYFGSLITFTLRDEHAANDWLAGLRMVVGATSFGGVVTSAERRARWGGDDVHPGLIRLSVGIEEPEDVLSDLHQALEGLPPP